MKAVWKFPVATSDAYTVQMPSGAQLLTIQPQNGLPTLWALVDPSAPQVERAFRAFGTGHEHPDERFGEYVGTYQLMDGSLVFHVFDMGEGGARIVGQGAAGGGGGAMTDWTAKPGALGWYVVDSNDTAVCMAGSADAYAQGQAEYIARACNAHQSLVEALEACEAWMAYALGILGPSGLQPPASELAEGRDIAELARTTLKLAGAEVPQ